jgi:hypothetical protein
MHGLKNQKIANCIVLKSIVAAFHGRLLGFCVSPKAQMLAQRTLMLFRVTVSHGRGQLVWAEDTRRRAEVIWNWPTAVLLAPRPE